MAALRPRAAALRPRAAALLTAVALLLPVSTAVGQSPLPVDPPVLGAETPRGSATWMPADAIIPAALHRTVDGDASDWAGEATMFGGTAVHSAGELVYTDHLFDAHGADDGSEAERRAVLGPVEEAVPETYRAEAAVKANIPGQVGAPAPGPLASTGQYGALPYQPHADLAEVRLADHGDALWLLARTVQLHPDDATGILVLVDRSAGGGGAVPFDSGLSTDRADVAVLLRGETGWVADLASGAVAELPPGSVATQPGGFTNAVEARLPQAVLGVAPDADLAVAVAAGRADGSTIIPANVAFRFAEPVREWFDQEQALALGAGDIDAFFVGLDRSAIATSRTDRLLPGPGYHDRIFLSTTPGLAQESGREGLWQHYGVYLPSTIDGGDALPLQWWLHWRGGTAHVAGMVTPGIFRHMGEDRDGIVVSPRGRGTSTWYVGRGHADFLEVWEDVFATFPIDDDRVYLSGHSMGGWGSYLLAVLYPDRFAASFPVAGPVTQGAWTGLDFPGCDSMSNGEYTPCYISANGGRPRDQHTRRMLDNLRNVPITMFYAGADELVPVSGASRQAERLVELGYRHRFVLFPAHEHYTHPIVDEWAEGVRYLDRFRRDADPPRVTYVRDMPFEHAVREVQSGGITFDFTFDSAYWMSGLEAADPETGRARFDGRSLAKPEAPVLAAADAGAGPAVNQTMPFAFAGLQWLDHPLAPAGPALNAFEATLTGATAVRLELSRMGIDAAVEVAGEVTTDRLLQLRLAGGWERPVRVRVGTEEPRMVSPVDGELTIPVASGSHLVVITP